MIGNEQVRFCEHCSLKCTNLSLMTRNQAARLVARLMAVSAFVSLRPRGRPRLYQCGKRSTRINRRVSRIAAGAFSATLEHHQCCAQNSTNSQTTNVDAANATQPNTRWRRGQALWEQSSTRMALASNATIFLSNTDLRLAL